VTIGDVMKFTPLERDVIGWIVRHCDDEASRG
jgi:hypothetical protein